MDAPGRGDAVEGGRPVASFRRCLMLAFRGVGGKRKGAVVASKAWNLRFNMKEY